MSEMKAFILWFLSELPDFLMSEPICYFVGFMIAFFVVALIRNIMFVSR